MRTRIKFLIVRKRAALTMVVLFTAASFLVAFLNCGKSRAANYTFFQTDWSGGASVNVATHASNQTGWDEYLQKDADVSATSDVRLSDSALTKIFTTNSDFSSGSNANTVINNDAIVLARALLGSIEQVVVGTGGHACALKTDGTVYCWGRNLRGAIGDNTTTNRYTPVQVLGIGGSGTLSDVSQIAAGGYFTCALKTDGTVYCWGQGIYGEVGDGAKVNRLTPVQVLDVGGVGMLSGVSQISSGFNHSCALKTDGSVYCWGDNPYGQIGDNTTTQRPIPVQVLGVGGSGTLSDVSQVSAGGNHTCVLKNDSSVFCWGANNDGRLGDNTTIQRNAPVQVLGVGGIGMFSGVTQLTSHGSHNCALRTDGGVYCWGFNISGELGDNTTSDRHVPVQVLGVGGIGTLSNITEIAAGSNHSCALNASGNLFCWGSNDWGQLGDNTTTQHLTPAQVHDVDGSGVLSDVSDVAGGGAQSCALKVDGSVNCWGYNGFGGLGDGTITQRNSPVQVLGIGYYAASGTYTSVIADLNLPKYFSTLEYTVSTPANTTISIDVRAGDNPAPDGTWTAWQNNIANGGSLIALNGKRYVQFRVNLATTDSAATPSLNDITFSYYPTSDQEIVSSIYNTENTLIAISGIQWTENIPSGSDISVQLRTSQDGTTWGSWCGPDDGVSGSCNSSTYFTSPSGGEIIDDTQRDGTDDQYFQYRILLSSTGGNPSLSDISISYSDDPILSSPVINSLQSDSVSSITSTSAVVTASIAGTGGENPQRFIQWGIESGNYTQNCDAGTGGIGDYSCNLTNLTPNTTYYVRAYATNSAGTTYGNEISFSTTNSDSTAPAAPEIEDVKEITKDSVKLKIQVDPSYADQELDFEIKIKNKDKNDTDTKDQSKGADENGEVILTIDDLKSGTDYSISVRFSPKDQENFSDYSEAEKLKTERDIEDDEKSIIENLRAEKKGETIFLSWDKARSEVNGILIERKLNDGSFKKIVSLDDNDTSYKDNDIKTEGKYTYRARGYAGDKYTPYSKEAFAIVGQQASSQTETEQENQSNGQTEFEPQKITTDQQAEQELNIKQDQATIINPKINTNPQEQKKSTFSWVFNEAKKLAQEFSTEITTLAFAGLAAGTAIAASSTGIPLFPTSPEPLNQRLLGVIGILSNRKKESEDWGTVFDSETKQPIRGVIIALINQNGHVVDTTVSDSQGRYGFLPNPGIFTISVSKNDYKLKTEESEDPLYGSVYMGDNLTVQQGEIENINISLKNTRVDWQDFAKRKIASLTSVFSIFKRDFFLILFYSGAIISVGIALMFPTPLNIIIFFIYLALIAYQLFFKKKSFGTITHIQSGKPVPFAIVSLYGEYEPEKRLKFAVSDALGRYYLLAENGNYLVKISGSLLGGSRFEKLIRTRIEDGILRADVGV